MYYTIVYIGCYEYYFMYKNNIENIYDSQFSNIFVTRNSDLILHYILGIVSNRVKYIFLILIFIIYNGYNLNHSFIIYIFTYY